METLINGNRRDRRKRKDKAEKPRGKKQMIQFRTGSRTQQQREYNLLRAWHASVSRPARHEIDEIDKLPVSSRPASPPKSVDSLFRNLNNTQPSAASEPGPTPPAVANMNDPFRTQVLPPNTKNSAPSTPVSSITAASHSSTGSAQNQPPSDR
ncbi:hypothetical protein DFH11DRAFT_1815257 [Phellopilus nigrolimitatus]|nr:hypothetical protein DFH11DRAFT_1815257 [Phellopilus nigrolimitatus]